jgi:hypothetical protein
MVFDIIVPGLVCLETLYGEQAMNAGGLFTHRRPRRIVQDEQELDARGF